MAKKAQPSVKPVRPLDPAWRIKFKSTGELTGNRKTGSKKPSKGVS